MKLSEHKHTCIPLEDLQAESAASINISIGSRELFEGDFLQPEAKPAQIRLA